MFGPFFKNTPPFDDPRVREAIDLWLDRKEFVDIGSPRGGSFYDAGVLPAEQGGKWGLPPEEIMNRPGYRMVDATGKVVTTVEELNLKRGELRKDPRDRERAKELLAQIGIRSGQVKTEVPTAVFEVTRGGPVFVAQMKGLFGAVWSMKPYPAGPSFGTDISQGRFTVSYSAHSGYGIDEPSVSLHGWLTSGSTPPQVGGWPAEDPNQRKLDQLFSEQDTILDAVKRREVIWDMQRTLLDWRIRPVTMNSEGGGAYWPDVKNPPDAKTAFSNVWRLDRVWLTK
jgi:peptide/nickel transport system substrate-binding protein